MSQEERKRSADKKTKRFFLVFMLQKYEVFLSRNPSFPHFFTHRLSYGQKQGRKRLRDKKTKRQKDKETKSRRDKETKGLKDKETKRQRDKETKRQRDKESKRGREERP